MTTIKLSPFEFSKIIILESLPCSEAQTGTQLLPIIQASLSKHNREIVAEVRKFQGSQGFHKILEDLCIEAKAGDTPILQIECHGDIHTGLHFADDSNVSWPELADALRRLNRETKFNLVVVISACFGAYFLGMLSPLNAAPCYALVSATDEIVPYEIRTGFTNFYEDLFASLDIGAALTNLGKRKTFEGAWYSKSAEWWFLQVVKNHGAGQIRSSVKENWVDFNNDVRPKHMPPVSKTAYFENVRGQNKVIVKKWFDLFFVTTLIPANADRFRQTLEEAEAYFAALRGTGDYVL
jgi:hypothetical protein